MGFHARHRPGDAVTEGRDARLETVGVRTVEEALAAVL